MILKAVFFSGIIIGLAACSGSRALPEEWPLFPDSTASKWWIVNGITTDVGGDDMHLCLLFSFSPVNGKYYTTFFSSFWWEADGTYHTGTRSADVPFLPEKKQFPILLEIPGRDSSELEWYWTLGRKRMRLQCQVREVAGEVLPVSVTMKLARKGAFQPLETVVSSGETPPEAVSMRSDYSNPFFPATYSLPPIATDTRLPAPWKYKAGSLLSVHAIQSGEDLLKITRNNYVGWLDLFLDNGQHLSLLYETDGKAFFRNLGHNAWFPDGKLRMMPEPQFRADTSEVWTSPASGKTYPTKLEVSFPEVSIFLKIRPRKPEQENGTGNNALWMGAVETVDPITGAVSGRGNMYILKQ